MKKLLIWLVGIFVVLYVLLIAVAWALSALAEALGAVQDAGESSAGLFGRLLSYLGNPFFLLALAGVVALVLWRKQESADGSELAARKLWTRLSRDGLKDYVLARKGRSLFAVGAVLVVLWFFIAKSIAGFLIVFVPFAGAALYARRREKRRASGESDPEAALVPAREVASPLWAFQRYQGLTVDYEAWLLLAKHYQSRRKYEHWLLSGQTGIGKGQTILMQAVAHSIACGSASTVIGDPKAELYEEMLPVIAAQPDRRPMWLFSFMEKHPDNICAAINPVRNHREARRFASSVVPPTREPVWANGARRLFEAVAGGLGYPPDCVLAVYRTIKYPKRLEELADVNEDVEAVWRGGDEKHKGMVESFRKNLETALSALDDPKVARVFRATEETERLDFRGRNAVFVCFDSADADSIGPITAALIDHIYCLAREGGQQDGPGVEFIIDEAARFASLHKFPEYLALARGDLVRFGVAVQNYSQLEAALDEEGMRDVMDSVAIKIFGRTGEDDRGSARILEEISGTIRVRAEGAQRKVPLWMIPITGLRQRYLTNLRRYQMIERPRVKAQHLRELPQGWWYVVTGDSIENVGGVPWHSHFKDKIVDPELAKRPVNRAGLVPDGSAAPIESQQASEEAPESPSEPLQRVEQEPNPADRHDPSQKPQEPAGDSEQNGRECAGGYKEPPAGPPEESETPQRTGDSPEGRPKLRVVTSHESPGESSTRTPEEESREEEDSKICPYCERESAARDAECWACGMPI